MATAAVVEETTATASPLGGLSASLLEISGFDEAVAAGVEGAVEDAEGVSSNSARVASAGGGGFVGTPVGGGASLGGACGAVPVGGDHCHRGEGNKQLHH